eukprot:3423_1
MNNQWSLNVSPSHSTRERQWNNGQSQRTVESFILAQYRRLITKQDITWNNNQLPHRMHYVPVPILKLKFQEKKRRMAANPDANKEEELKQIKKEAGKEGCLGR